MLLQMELIGQELVVDSITTHNLKYTLYHLLKDLAREEVLLTSMEQDSKINQISKPCNAR